MPQSCILRKAAGRCPASPVSLHAMTSSMTQNGGMQASEPSTASTQTHGSAGPEASSRPVPLNFAPVGPPPPPAPAAAPPKPQACSSFRKKTPVIPAQPNPAQPEAPHAAVPPLCHLTPALDHMLSWGFLKVCCGIAWLFLALHPALPRCDCLHSTMFRWPLTFAASGHRLPLPTRESSCDDGKQQGVTGVAL